MKKFLTLALALVMALALAAPAMAFSSESADDLTLEGYSFDFYLVEYVRNDYFGGDDVIVTDLPESGRGYVTNEVVAAMVTAVVPEDSDPADDIQMTIDGENVSFFWRDERAITSASVRAKWSADNNGDRYDDPDEYNFTPRPAANPDKWVMDDPEVFEGDPDDDYTLRWLVFAKVTDDDASLTLTVELDAAPARQLVLDGVLNGLYRSQVEFDVGKYDYEVYGYEHLYDDSVPPVGTLYNNSGPVINQGLVDVGMNVANDGMYKILANHSPEMSLVILYNEDYRANVMLVFDGSDWYLIDKDGVHQEKDATSITAASVDRAGLDALVDDAYAVVSGIDATVEESDLFDVGATDWWSELFINAVSNSNDALAVQSFVDKVCDDLNLDPAKAGNKLRPGDIGPAATADEELEITIDIEPWQAYVTIPDIEVVDPPKTGDAATLAGFVMIVLAAAGVVVFKKVRA